MIKKLSACLNLGRIGMAPMTMSVPIVGALTLGQPLPLQMLLLLGVLGLCAHLFGFALNDIIDHPLDRTLPTHHNHPLTTGKLTQREAWIFTLIQLPIAIGIYWILPQRLSVSGSGLGLPILCLSMALSVAYNLWSKWGNVPSIVAELSLAASVGLLCVSGTLLLGQGLPPQSLLFGAGLSIMLLLLNSVPSGLKDLKTDAAYGARSFVLSVGGKMVGGKMVGGKMVGGKMVGGKAIDTDGIFIPKKLWIYSMILQGFFMLCTFVLMILTSLSWLSIALIVLLQAYACLHLRMVLALRSFRRLRRSLPLLNGYYNYVTLVSFVVAWMPMPLQLLYYMGALGLLLIPWQRSYRLWRGRYLSVAPKTQLSEL